AERARLPPQQLVPRAGRLGAPVRPLRARGGDRTGGGARGPGGGRGHPPGHGGFVGGGMTIAGRGKERGAGVGPAVRAGVAVLRDMSVDGESFAPLIAVASVALAAALSGAAAV